MAYLWNSSMVTHRQPPPSENQRHSRPDHPFRKNRQGFEGARLQVLRAHDHLCVHAGCRHGGRSSRRSAADMEARNSRLDVLRGFHPAVKGFAIARHFAQERRRLEACSVLGDQRVAKVDENTCPHAVDIRQRPPVKGAKPKPRMEPTSASRGSVTTCSAMVRAASTACTTKNRCFSSVTLNRSGSSFLSPSSASPGQRVFLPPPG